MQAYILSIIRLLGGLALFLFGMDVMGKALERQAGGKLQGLLAKMSSNVLKGFLLGLGVTAVIQSSSATTVMVVGFVNSGIMTLKQAVGVIMGSNIGTTVTAWVLSLSGLQGDSLIVQIFKPEILAAFIGTIGIVLFMFTRRERLKGFGTIMLGFLALMVGMSQMSNAMKFLEEEAWFGQLMISFSNPLLGILFGALLTALIQSSSASVGILQSLCITGAVSYGAAIPIILGQNIGTCITAILGAVGANRNARRAATLHLLFNVVGVLLFVIAFYGLGLFIDWKFLAAPAAAWDIAVIHTLFNVSATAVLLPLNGLLVKLAYIIIPDTKEQEQTVLLDERLLVTPAVAVRRAQDVAGQMALTAQKAMELASSLTVKYDPEVMQQVMDLEQETDRYEDALGSYLVKLSDQKLSVEDNRVLNTLLYTVSDMERLGDHALNVAEAAQKMHDKNIVFSTQAQQELAVLQRAVGDIIRRAVNAYTAMNLDEAAKVEPQEQVIDALVREIKARHVRRLRDGKCSVEYGFVLEDLLTAYERSADHCSNIAVEILQVAEGKLEAHEYLNALKAGELEESAKFNRRFNRYRARYTFPDEE
ncbi:MAG: Na/Pi cotransporter family protein [Oscillospiraceae bacterium]|nr:Na/Pi cotransporter family protein [Oscillospiraceae bacterium]MBQ8797746.1 Na/Pi cotransporter family protein [Oscillospiraceae bacterium]